MIARDLHSILGTEERDPGCDASFEVFDEYCDAVLRGERVAERFAHFLTHLANCTTCREDAESLLAALRDRENSGAG
jgi:hypothetical protein